MHKTFYGENLHGRFVDEILREFFPDYEYKDCFLDIGAFEPIRISNSHHFHMNGWDVHAIEANPTTCELLRQHRQHVYNCAVADTCKDSVTFHVVSNGDPTWTAGYSAINISDEYRTIFPGGIKTVDQITVPQRTVNSLMENEMKDVTSIGIVSLDIEGGEYDCLLGFDLKKYQPKMFVIENVTKDAKIDAILEQNGYVRKYVIMYNHYWVHQSWLDVLASRKQ